MSSPPFCSTILPKSFDLTNLSAAAMSSFQAFSSSFSFAVIVPHCLVALGDVSGISDLDFCERGFLGGVIRGADLVGALERHVLEHVGEPGGAHRVLRGAGIDQREERENRSLRALTDYQSEPVGQFLHRDALLERRDILGDSATPKE